MNTLAQNNLILPVRVPQTRMHVVYLAALAAVASSYPVTTNTINYTPSYYNGTQNKLLGQVEALSVIRQRETPIGQYVAKIKFILNLTFEEIASLFGVSRRSIHNWINGERISSNNEAHIRAVYTAIIPFEGSKPRSNRDSFLSPLVGDTQASLFSLLKDNKIEEFKVHTASLPTFDKTQQIDISKEERVSRLGYRSVHFHDAVIDDPKVITKAAIHRYKKKNKPNA